MRVQDLLIGLLIFSLVTTTILGFAFSTYDRMDVVVDGNTSAVLRSFERQANQTGSDMFGITAEMQRAAPGGDEVAQDTSKTFNDNIFASGWAVINMIPQSFAIFNNVLRVIGDAIGVDSVFIRVFFACMVIVMVLIFISSVLYNKL